MADIAALVTELQADPVGMGYALVADGHSAAHALYSNAALRPSDDPLSQQVLLEWASSSALLDKFITPTGTAEVKSASRFLYEVIRAPALSVLDTSDAAVAAMLGVLVTAGVMVQADRDALEALAVGTQSRGSELANPATVKDMRKAFKEII